MQRSLLVRGRQETVHIGVGSKYLYAAAGIQRVDAAQDLRQLLTPEFPYPTDEVEIEAPVGLELGVSDSISS